MKFKTVNEIGEFIYKDCFINEVHLSGEDVSLMVEALIVKSSNSMNSNYTNSYAGDTNILFSKGKIKSITLVGLKKYDANDNLIEEIPDKVVEKTDVEIKGLFEGAYLASMEEIEKGIYSLYIELATEDATEVTDSYEMMIECEEVIIEWDKYLNRVQEM